jgi:hypothetical protein
VPPNYPGSAPPGRPVRCFASQAEEVRAGFRPAPTPPGDVIVDGVYLVPTSASLGAVCARAAAKLRYAVPCPSMLPNPARGGPSSRCGAAAALPFPGNPSCVANIRGFDYSLYEGSYRPAPALYAFLFAQGVFAVPPSWVSASGIVSSGLVIVGAPPSATGALRSMLCAGGTIMARAVVNGRQATVRECHNSASNATQTLLSWTQNGIVYDVAVFGPVSSTGSLAEAVAQRIHLVSPT